MADDLTRPLRGRPPRRQRVPLAGILLTAIGVGLVAAAGWTIFSWDPGAVPAASVPIQTATAGSGGEVVIRAPEAANAGVTIRTPDGLPASGGVIIREVGAPAPIVLDPRALPALLEDGRHGALPRVGPDGTRPFDAYARPAPAAGTLPRIAIIVGGLGISAAGTEQALSRLPPEVALALAAEEPGLPNLGSRAREAGHETFLQVPFEPLDFPVNNPGAHTLTVEGDAAGNLDRLAWMMARFSAYAGVITYAGGRFLGEPAALQPVVDELARRGLMLVDDGTALLSRSADVAMGVLPYAAADLVLDTQDNPALIASRLAQLEAIARERGTAIASASAFPTTIDAIVAWAATARERGFVLVPITALANDPGAGVPVVRVP